MKHEKPERIINIIGSNEKQDDLKSQSLYKAPAYSNYTPNQISNNPLFNISEDQSENHLLNMTNQSIDNVNHTSFEMLTNQVPVSTYLARKTNKVQPIQLTPHLTLEQQKVISDIESLIRKNSKPDFAYPISIPEEVISNELQMSFSILPELLASKIIRFNESGNKTLKFNYPTFSLSKFEAFRDQQIPELTKAAVFKIESKQKANPTSSNFSQFNKEIDLNEDFLDNFSEAEYSIVRTSQENVDKPEKIRKLMEKQQNISKREEQFYKKLEGIKDTFKMKSEPNPQDEKLNLNVSELEKRSQKILDEVRRSIKKSNVDSKKNSFNTKRETNGSKTNNFFEKFQSFVESQTTSFKKRIDQYEHSEESYNESFRVPELDQKFDNIKSLNCFVSPSLRAKDLINPDYLEYVGFNQTDIRSSLEKNEELRKSVDYLKSRNLENLVFNVDPKFDSNAVPLQDLTHPKVMERDSENNSIFSGKHSKSNDEEFPYSQEPPSQSFDYFAPAENEEVPPEINPGIDKRISSDFHHYNQKYLQKYYKNYAEEVNEVYLKENHPESFKKMQLEQLNQVEDLRKNIKEENQLNEEEEEEEEEMNGNAEHSEKNSDKQQMFKNENAFFLETRRAESDKFKFNHEDPVNAPQYFSFNRDKDM